MLTCTGNITRTEENLLKIEAVWYSSDEVLDRPMTMAWVLKEKSILLAQRLKNFLESGYIVGKILKDVNGKTYVESDYGLVNGRTLNADLKRYGY